MADVYAIFGTLLALGIAFPGFLCAWWLIAPGKVELARQRVAATPWRSFFTGLGAALILAIPVVILFAFPFAFSSFLGGGALLLIFCLAGIGAAGICAQMAGRLKERSRDSLTDTGAFVRAAVAFELSAAFPLIGWLLIIPVSLILSLGASAFALLSWAPKTKAERQPPPQLQSTEA